MAWHFRPKESKTTAFYNLEYYSVVNARKKKKRNQKLGFEKKPLKKKNDNNNTLHVVGEVVNDTLPVVEFEGSFSHGKYLIYVGGGDRCKNMNQYLFYFDFEHLRESTFVLDHIQFWANWNKWQKKDRLNLHFVEDFRVTPTKLADVKHALIMRKFGYVEPDNYWYRVYEGETESIVQRPGEKVKNKDLWPKLDRDTSTDALLSTLHDKIEDGRNLYIATNEPDKSFFDPLKDKYSTYFLNEFEDLWDENSECVPVEFDGYMRVSVDTKVLLRGKK
ncbi:hypothetical protein UlMin_045397 [Ulmus minor]